MSMFSDFLDDLLGTDKKKKKDIPLGNPGAEGYIAPPPPGETLYTQPPPSGLSYGVEGTGAPLGSSPPQRPLSWDETPQGRAELAARWARISAQRKLDREGRKPPAPRSKALGRGGGGGGGGRALVGRGGGRTVGGPAVSGPDTEYLEWKKERDEIMAMIKSMSMGGGGGYGDAPVFDPSSAGPLGEQYAGGLLSEMSSDIYDQADEAMGAAVSNFVGRGLGRSTLAPGGNIVKARTKALGSASRAAKTEGAKLGLAGARAKWESEMATWQGQMRGKESKRQTRLQGLRMRLGMLGTEPGGSYA